MSTTTEIGWQRITASAVEVGDTIARTRDIDRAQEVDAIVLGDISVRFLNDSGQTIMRPRQSARLWKATAATARYVAEKGNPGWFVQDTALDQLAWFDGDGDEDTAREMARAANAGEVSI